MGYGYPNLLVSESYNSPGSPYWAFKAFAPLAVPESHPFWQAEEAPYSPRAGVTALKQPGMVRWEEPGNVSVLVAGQEALPMRQGPEKYSKFAYSTRYGFSVENDSRTFANGPLDNMLAFSEDGRHAFVRESEADARIGEDYLYSAWSPMAGVTVESWILARPPWHLRIHRVVSARKVSTVEGGFSIRRTDAPPVRGLPQMPAARLADAPPPDAAFRRGEVATEEDLSIIVDLGPTPRGARVLQAQPNTNVIFPRSWVPQLLAQLEPSTTLLASAICARTVALGDPGEPLALPSEDDLQRMKAEAPRVPVWDV